MTEFEQIERSILAASRPEEVFGVLKGPAASRLLEGTKVYRRLARIVHPDRAAGRSAAFTRLTAFWETAKDRIRRGIYGETTLFEVTIPARKVKGAVVPEVVYHADRLMVAGLAGWYEGHDQTRRVWLEIADTPADNEFSVVAAKAVELMAKEDPATVERGAIPKRIESVLVGGRRVNIYAAPFPDQRVYPLSEIMAAYPDELDPRDAVWMWKRCLGTIGFVHAQGFIHGGLVPSSILVDIQSHGATLIDWGSAAWKGELVKVLRPRYRALYPTEVTERTGASRSTDLYMLAMTVLVALGGDPITHALPKRVPDAMARLLRGCLLSAPSHRLDDAHDLHLEIDRKVLPLFGPRVFRPFHMPPKES